MPKVIDAKDFEEPKCFERDMGGVDLIVRETCKRHSISLFDKVSPSYCIVTVYSVDSIDNSKGRIFPAINAGQGNISVNPCMRIVKIDMPELLPVATDIATQLEERGKRSNEWYVLRDYKEVKSA